MDCVVCLGAGARVGSRVSALKLRLDDPLYRRSAATCLDPAHHYALALGPIATALSLAPTAPRGDARKRSGFEEYQRAKEGSAPDATLTAEADGVRRDVERALGHYGQALTAAGPRYPWRLGFLPGGNGLLALT